MNAPFVMDDADKLRIDAAKALRALAASTGDGRFTQASNCLLASKSPGPTPIDDADDLAELRRQMATGRSLAFSIRVQTRGRDNPAATAQRWRRKLRQ